jgi:hypothetical protein
VTVDEPRSEQEELLELAAEPAEDDPRSWREADPDLARETDGFPAGHQISATDDGRPTDDEATEIAVDGGSSVVAGPEQQAVHIEAER